MQYPYAFHSNQTFKSGKGRTDVAAFAKLIFTKLILKDRAVPTPGKL